MELRWGISTSTKNFLDFVCTYVKMVDFCDEVVENYEKVINFER